MFQKLVQILQYKGTPIGTPMGYPMFQSNPKETDFCLHRQQRFEKTFANESKYYNISVNISAEISNIINVSWVKLALYVKNILDLFKCLTVSTCFTKILTVAIEPPLFTSVGVLCEFAMVPGVYILLSPQEEELNFTLCFQRIQMHTFSRIFIKKI